MEVMKQMECHFHNGGEYVKPQSIIRLFMNEFF